MSGWERFRSSPRLPPPEHGIRVKKAGTTWWGLRWIEALERVLRGDARRLARGKTYARAGRTHDLVVSAGSITARVTGTRPTPYAVSIELARFSDEVWQRAIEGLAAKAQFAAALLAGQMPEAIDEVFRAAGTSLFPEQRSDLVTSCTCPDSGDPCKHVAATHYLLGEALDGDPFLLFELRGRSQARVLAEIRAARAGDAAAPGAGEPAAGGAVVPAVTLDALDPREYDRPRGALPALEFSFDAPSTTAAVLRQLGAPRAWRGEASPAELLAPLVQRAALAARRLALGEASAEAGLDAGAESDPPERKRDERKRDERKPDERVPETKAVAAPARSAKRRAPAAPPTTKPAKKPPTKKQPAKKPPAKQKKVRAVARAAAPSRRAPRSGTSRRGG